jgi:hypothetical protein
MVRALLLCFAANLVESICFVTANDWQRVVFGVSTERGRVSFCRLSERVSSPGCWQPGAKPGGCFIRAGESRTRAPHPQQGRTIRVSHAHRSDPGKAGNVTDAINGMAALPKRNYPAMCLQGLRPPEVAQQPGPPCGVPAATVTKRLLRRDVTTACRADRLPDCEAGRRD